VVKLVEIGQQIGEVTCPGCGRPDLPVKVNRGGNVYYFCAAIIGERNGKKEKCFTRHTFGRSASERIKAEYLEQEAINARDQVHEEKQQPPATTETTGDTHVEPPKPRAGNPILDWITG